MSKGEPRRGLARNFDVNQDDGVGEHVAAGVMFRSYHAIVRPEVQPRRGDLTCVASSP